MTIQVVVQSGSGGALLVIVSTQLDDISPGAALSTQAFQYRMKRGSSTLMTLPRSSRAGAEIYSEAKAASGAGTTRLLSYPCKDWTLEVRNNVGSTTAWDVDLQVSFDGVTWTTILNHATADLIGAMKWVSGRLAFAARFNVNSITTTGSALVVFAGESA